MSEANTSTTTGSVFDNAIALCVTIGRLGVKRKVSSGKVAVRDATEETPTDPRALAVSKELIDCAEYDAIQTIDNGFRVDLVKVALPSPLRRGMYLVPVGLVSRVSNAIEEYEGRRRSLVDAFVAAYSGAVRSARARLGTLWAADDYPHVDDVRAAFTVRTRWESFGVPALLERVDADLFRQERGRIQAELRDAQEEIRTALRAGLADLVSHLSERLAPGPDGKPRIFRDSAVRNVTEWLDLFQHRNITGDAQLAELVTQARSVLRGVDAESLRRAPMIRDSVRAGLDEINERLAPLVTERPRRRFDFSEDPAAAPPAPPAEPPPSIPAPPDPGGSSLPLPGLE
jgi:hypothetical protein